MENDVLKRIAEVHCTFVGGKECRCGALLKDFLRDMVSIYEMFRRSSSATHQGCDAFKSKVPENLSQELIISTSYQIIYLPNALTFSRLSLFLFSKQPARLPGGA